MFEAAEMLRIYAKYRGSAIVVPGRGARHWNRISSAANRDIPLGDPAMGGHASFAFGLALAQPKERVVLFDSEGDLLMNLGALGTIAEAAPANFYHFLMDNECYATTGGQPVPNAKNIRYADVARDMGYPRVYFFDQLEEFANSVEGILSQPGPLFVHMKILPEVENLPINQRPRWNTRTLDQVLADVKRELKVAR
jgi:thiamine pyrophosphate-dependent acetolactate synthase large subunit-like protein